jgi:hypothetical protein
MLSCFVVTHQVMAVRRNEEVGGVGTFSTAYQPNKSGEN